MAIQEYIVGQPVRFIGRFWDDPEMTQPTDPSTVKLWIRDWEGTDTELEYATDVDRDEEGVYSYVLVPDHQGDWKWRWESTAPDTAFQGVITVYDRNAGS